MFRSLSYEGSPVHLRFLHAPVGASGSSDANIDAARETCDRLRGEGYNAITDQYPEEDVYPGWAEICRLRTIPIDFINAAVMPDMSRYPESIPTVAIPVGDNEPKKCAYQIRSNCYCKGELWGHLYIYYPDKDLDPAVLQLARCFADVYGELLDRIMGRTQIGRAHV